MPDNTNDLNQRVMICEQNVLNMRVTLDHFARLMQQQAETLGSVIDAVKELKPKEE